MTDRVKTIEDTLKAELTEQVRFLEYRAEGGNRCNNIRVVGLPEGSEVVYMVAYLENWPATKVAPQRLSKFFALDRAHKKPTHHPPPQRGLCGQ